MGDPVTASAKAIEESAKAAGKALDIVHDSGGYLRQVFGDLIVNAVGWIIGDWVGQKRLRNFDALCRRTIEIFRERNTQNVIELSPNQATELLTAAQDESRPELAELWARLLANAMDPNLNSVRHSFIDAVKKMDPQDTLILKLIREGDFLGIRRRSSPQETRVTNIDILADKLHCRVDQISISLEHLQAINFFTARPSTNADGQDFFVTVSIGVEV